MDFFLSSLWGASIIFLGVAALVFVASKVIEWSILRDADWGEFDK